MSKRKRTVHYRMPHLRAWRESKGLSRQAVANRIGEIRLDLAGMDQATIAKWESGETAVKVEDLELLAQVYGVTADRLFFAPGDARLPEWMKRAYEVFSEKSPEAVEAWLEMGKNLSRRDVQSE
ncbi:MULTISPECIES: helix-turn-helix domain-containing protein [Komagataeibacter]|nr:helix-turn-helix transcriptional regulator [Komagataeibacter diospyri]